MQKLTAKDLTKDHSGRRASFLINSTHIIGEISVVDTCWLGTAVVDVKGIPGTLLLNEDLNITILEGTELKESTTFEDALDPVKSTGIDFSTRPFIVNTVAEAEQVAAYWLNEAVKMHREEAKREEENKKRVKEVCTFYEEVLGYGILVPNKHNFEQYDKAVAWAESRGKSQKVPRTLEAYEARNADKSVVWVSESAPLNGGLVRFRYNDSSKTWQWWTDERGWNDYSGPHLGRLDPDYFPMEERIDEES